MYGWQDAVAFGEQWATAAVLGQARGGVSEAHARLRASRALAWQHQHGACHDAGFIPIHENPYRPFGWDGAARRLQSSVRAPMNTSMYSVLPHLLSTKACRAGRAVTSTPPAPRGAARAECNSVLEKGEHASGDGRKFPLAHLHIALDLVNRRTVWRLSM